MTPTENADRPAQGVRPPYPDRLVRHEIECELVEAKGEGMSKSKDREAQRIGTLKPLEVGLRRNMKQETGIFKAHDLCVESEVSWQVNQRGSKHTGSVTSNRHIY